MTVLLSPRVLLDDARVGRIDRADYFTMIKLPAKIIVLILALLTANSPLLAQHKREATPRKPVTAPAQDPESAPTFDTLLAGGTYKIYVEIRGVGQLVHSQPVNDVIDPALKILGGAKEFKTILKWLDAHADSLAASRAFVAAWPSKKNLPDAMVAIEFSSPEEAQKFAPELRRFIPTLTDAPQATSSKSASEPATSTFARPSLHIMNAGSLVMMSEKPFSLAALKPRKARLMVEDPNFVVAHNRFASESLFVYVDVKAIEKEEQEQRQKWQEEERRRIEEEASRPKPEPSPEVEEPTIIEQTQIETVTPTPSDASSAANANDSPGDSRDAQALNALTSSLYAALFSGQPHWPEAIAAAANFEDDAYVVRALVLNGAESKVLPVPFFPHFVSGPAVTPQSPAVLPGDADLFVSASLDYQQIYDGLLRTIAVGSDRARQSSAQVLNAPPPSPFSEYEKKLGMKIKDEVLPMFGNEVALAFVPKSVDSAVTSAQVTTGPPKMERSDPEPIVAIAIKDKEGVQRLIPKLIDSFGFRGASALAQTERKDDTEIVSYANMLSYAFIGDFLVVAPNANLTKRAVADYLSGETLAASNRFRNAKRWQSRDVLAQVYVAPLLIQKYAFGVRTNNNTFVELMSRLATVEPLTYSISNEGAGPLHELHVPKSLLSFVVANALNDVNNRSLSANEASAQSALRTLVSAEETYKASKGDGHYGTLEQLVTENLISSELLQRYGYRIDLTVSTNKFEATAVPLEYEKTGKLSFFVDESSVVRGGDHGGGAATISDPPID